MTDDRKSQLEACDACNGLAARSPCPKCGRFTPLTLRTCGKQECRGIGTTEDAWGNAIDEPCGCTGPEFSDDELLSGLWWSDPEYPAWAGPLWTEYVDRMHSWNKYRAGVATMLRDAIEANPERPE